MLIFFAGAMFTWLALCVLVVALCVAAKRGDRAMLDSEIGASQRVAIDASRGGAAPIARPLHLV